MQTVDKANKYRWECKAIYGHWLKELGAVTKFRKKNNEV
jgi:hypothetical protein